jgi:hypothetical protein
MGFVLALILMGFFASAAASAESRGVLPELWGGSVSVGYENRAEGTGGNGDPDLGTGNPRFWFTEPEDFLGTFRIYARWKFRPFRHATKVEIQYKRQEWMEGAILGRNLIELELRQGLTKRSRLELEVEYAPQIYLRHRVDKDAVSGEPRFRPEAYGQIDLELGYRRTLGPNFHATALASYTTRDETRWFEERDRTRRGLGLGLEFPVGGRTQVEPEYQYRVSTSRNEPDLGSDLSYREHLVELKLRTRHERFIGPWDLEMRTRWKFRRYTTDNQDDERRYKRDEQVYFWDIKLRRFFGRVAPFLSWEATGRWVDVPGNVEVVDEDGEIDRSFVELGLDWEF